MLTLKHFIILFTLLFTISVKAQWTTQMEEQVRLQVFQLAKSANLVEKDATSVADCVVEKAKIQMPNPAEISLEERNKISTKIGMECMWNYRHKVSSPNATLLSKYAMQHNGASGLTTVQKKHLNDCLIQKAKEFDTKKGEKISEAIAQKMIEDCYKKIQ